MLLNWGIVLITVRYCTFNFLIVLLNDFLFLKGKEKKNLDDNMAYVSTTALDATSCWSKLYQEGGKNKIVFCYMSSILKPQVTVQYSNDFDSI